MLKSLRKWLARRSLARLQTPRDVTRFAVHRHAERVALVHNGRKVTFAALGQRTLRIATAWHRQGVGPGDVVSVYLADGIAQIEARLAAAECGAVLNMLAPWASADEVLRYLGMVEPRLFVHGGADAELSRRVGRELPGLAQVALGPEREDWLAGIPARRVAVRVDPNTVGILAFTSGTTGLPKILAAPHGVSLTGLKMMVANVGFGAAGAPPDTMLVGIPMTGAGSGVLLPTLISGGCLVVPHSYDAQSLIECIARHRATRLFTTPSLLIDILDHPSLAQTDLSSLRNIIYGTETMPTPKLIEALHRFGPILQQGYGSAEVLPPVTLLQPQQHMQGGEPAPRATLLSCGQVVPQVQIRVIDEAGRDVPAGEPGELLVKSPTVFGGYWKRPDLSAQSLVDGWLRIGDVGTLSSDGWLTVLGRKPDLLQRNGRVIYPRLVEEAVHEHPAVKEATYVQRANEAVMVFSLRQAHRGRHPQEYWATELARHLKDRVPDWQLPDRYALFDELPRSHLGKVLRREVRDILATAPTAAQRAVEPEQSSVV